MGAQMRAAWLTVALAVALPAHATHHRSGDNEIPDTANRTLPADVEPLQSKLGFSCFYPSDAPVAGPTAYHGNRLLGEKSLVPHGGVVRFHCAVQNYYQLMGPEVVQCVDGAFNETLPVCERAFLEPRLVASVKADYVLGPGGLYVVPPNAPVEVTCRRTMSTGGGRPTWQWDANLDVFVKEGTFLMGPTSTIRMDPVDGSRGVFICSDGDEHVTLSLEARGDRCPRPPLGQGLLMRSNSIRAEFACSRGLLQGPMSVRCQHFRRWEQEPPSCFVAEGCPSAAGQEDGPQFPCVVPELPTALEAFADNRRVTEGQTVTPGQTLRFHCAPVGNFLIMGEAQAVCRHGSWSSKPPVCAVSVPHRLTINLNFPHAVAPGGVVHVLPYTEVNMVCSNNDPGLPPQWMLDVDVSATAKETPGYRESTSHLRFTAPAAGLKGNFECRSNPQSAYSESRTVQIQVKERTCPPLVPPSGLRMRANFEMAVFECEEPSQLVGASVLQCQPFGQWDYPVPHCLKPGRPETCPTRPPPQRPRGDAPGEGAEGPVGGGVGGGGGPGGADEEDPPATPENSPPLRLRRVPDLPARALMAAWSTGNERQRGLAPPLVH
ncbi:P-selectin-like [Haemaphysalis longicornis]